MDYFSLSSIHDALLVKEIHNNRKVCNCVGNFTLSKSRWRSDRFLGGYLVTSNFGRLVPDLQKDDAKRVRYGEGLTAYRGDFFFRNTEHCCEVVLLNHLS